MRYVLLPIMMITTIIPAGRAQEAARPSGAPLPARGVARLRLTPAPPGQIPSSFGDLSNRSSVIVEGVVARTLQSRETSPGSLETDAIVVPARIFKGPADLGQLVVSQRGGILGEFHGRPTQYALLQAARHYVLFLTEDTRANIPAVPGLKRYLITGLWSGLFELDAGRVRVDAEERDRLRREYDGITKDRFISEVLATLR